MHFCVSMQCLSTAHNLLVKLVDCLLPQGAASIVGGSKFPGGGDERRAAGEIPGRITHLSRRKYIVRPEVISAWALESNGAGSDHSPMCSPGLVSQSPGLVSLSCGIRLAQVHKRRKQASTWRQKELGYNAKDQRLVLATEDVAEALKEVRRCWATCCSYHCLDCVGHVGN